MFTFYEIQIDVCREKKITMICKQWWFRAIVIIVVVQL